MKNEFYEMYCEEVAKNEKLMIRVKKLEKGKDERIEKLKMDLKQSKSYIKSLEARLGHLETNMDEIATRVVEKAVEATSIAYEEKIAKLETQVALLKSTLNNNGNISGIPINREK